MIDRTSPFPPDFLILGAQKSGTTSMASALRMHPQIFLPRGKEAKHFGFVEDDAVGGADYREFFSAWAGQPVVGEATPEYLFNPRCAKQICRHLPDVRAIIQLRNPVERAYSAYWHGVRAGRLKGDFAEVIEAEFLRVDKDQSAFRDIVERGHYAEQIQRYLDNGFDRERMLILLLDDVLADKAGSLFAVQEFLGVEPVIMEFPRVNEARTSHLPRALRFVMFRHWRSRVVAAIEKATLRPFDPPPMDPDVRAQLVEHYRPWNGRLAELLGRDLSDWDR